MYCTICDSEEQVRPINLYTIGSEGTYLCHKCEMLVVEYIRDLRSKEARRRRNKYLAKKWFSETGEFLGHIPKRIAIECSHQGDCSNDVAFYLEHSTFHVPEELARTYLKGTGGWEPETLSSFSYDKIREIVFWIACCTIKKEGKWFGLIN
jgi:hypothetical protein